MFILIYPAKKITSVKSIQLFAHLYSSLNKYILELWILQAALQHVRAHVRASYHSSKVRPAPYHNVPGIMYTN